MRGGWWSTMVGVVAAPARVHGGEVISREVNGACMDGRNRGPAGRRGIGERLTGRLTRRGVIAGSGLAGVGLVASQLELLRSAAQESAAVGGIIDSLATLEAFLVTLVGVGRQRGDQMEIGAEVARYLRAAQCEDEAHYHFLIAAGAEAETTFTLPDRVFDDRATFLGVLVEMKEVAVGAAMAAARQFATAGDLRLVEIAYQIGTVEAQHLALTRLYRGELVANDRAFARWRFHAAAEAAQIVVDEGYIEGDGDEVDFPGPLSRQCRGVFGLVPETTEDQDQGPVASPVAT